MKTTILFSALFIIMLSASIFAANNMFGVANVNEDEAEDANGESDSGSIAAPSTCDRSYTCPDGSKVQYCRQSSSQSRYDLNGDSQVDNADMIFLRAEISKYDLTSDLAIDNDDLTAISQSRGYDATDNKIDVNKDGRIDNNDLIFLRAIIAKYDFTGDLIVNTEDISEIESARESAVCICSTGPSSLCPNVPIPNNINSTPERPVTCPDGCECRGEFTSCKSQQGKTISIRESQDEVTISTDNVESSTELEIEQEISQNKTRLRTRLSNGTSVDVKIMPDVASARARERLGELGFNITLKEVGKSNKTRAVYELTGNKEGRFLGIFKIMARVSAEVDAENGETRVIKPWWAFLASGI